jgi:hypothetical protein
MSNAPRCFRRPLSRHPWFFVAAACWLLLSQFSHSTSASGTILSTGFESPYVLGPLQGQFGWVTAGSGSSTAIVENSVVNSGTQAVSVTKAAAAGSDRRWAVPVSGYPTQRYVIVDWEMRVAQASVLTGFGPFFGVEAYDADEAPYLLGSLGVDATTGEVLYQAQDTGSLTPTGQTVNFNQWYHYRLVFDFATDTYRGFLNGASAALTGFVDRSFGLNNFTDADIATFAAAADPTSQAVSSSAIFDNFVIRDGLLGDYDNDGDVDNTDYTSWRQTFGTAISPAGNSADGNRNGGVDAGDYVIWRHNLGQSLFAGSGLASDVPVPEPIGLLTLSPVFILWFLSGKRKRS